MVQPRQRPTIDRQVGSREDGTDVNITGSEQPIQVTVDDVLWSDHEALSVGTTAVGITAALAAADYAMITCETGVVRFMVHGGTPTSTTGHILAVDGQLNLHSHEELLRAKFISRDGVTATLRVTVGRRVQP